MRITLDVPMTAPREALFRTLCDPLLRPRWQRSLRSVELESAGLLQLGSRWRERTKLGPEFAMQITAHDAPRLWAERGTSKGLAAELAVRLEPERDGTRFYLELSLTLPRLLSPFGVLAKPLVARELRADLERLDTLATSRSLATTRT